MTLTALTALAGLACSPGSDGAGGPVAPQPQRVERDFYLGGIQVNEESLDGWSHALGQRRFNTVHITDYALQGEWDSDDLRFDVGKPALMAEIRSAKARGLSVILVLRVHLETERPRNAFLWHGMIVPKTDALLESWFAKYTEYCEQWARIAEAEGVDALFFGSELNALASTQPVDAVPALYEYFLNEQRQAERRANFEGERDHIESSDASLDRGQDIESVEHYLDVRIANEQAWARTVVGERLDTTLINRRRGLLHGHWLKLVEDLRGVYSGPLGYAANFDQFHEVGFWPRVDVMGVNAYFPLRVRIFERFDADTLYPLLLDGWRAALRQIADLRARQDLDLPVVFTELGYTWRRRSTVKPWEHEGFSFLAEAQRAVVWQDEPKELRERALAIRALRQSHAELEEPFLRGILYWKLSSHDYHGDDEPYVIDIGAPSDDPALAELRAFLD
ncbi:MAG: hypothetical protein AAGF23_01145 [Acidobacteriota bacterium]